MKRYLFYLFCFYNIIGYSQNMKVVSFETSVFDIAASTNPRYDINGKIGSLIKVQLPLEGAVFESSMILGNVEYNAGEYKVYVASGTKHITVKSPKCLPVTIDFSNYGVNATESKTTYVLQILVIRDDISKFKKACVYWEPKMQIGGMTAIGSSIGGYYRHLNIELSYLMGLTNSKEVFWNTIDGGNPYSYTYRSSFIGGKIGYAFYLGKPFRVTPQIGIGSVQITGTEKITKNDMADASKGYAITASAGARIDYLILPWIGVGVAPRYSFPLKKSDLFSRVSEVSSKVKGFANGFNVAVNIFITF